MRQIERRELELRFAHHAPADEAIIRQHEDVRRICGNAAEDLVAILPPCRETSLAVTKLEEAMYHANAAIARTYSARRDLARPEVAHMTRGPDR